jgi:hypothetical protein
MMGQWGPKHVEVSGLYNIITLIQLCAFIGLNYSDFLRYCNGFLYTQHISLMPPQGWVFVLLLLKGLIFGFMSYKDKVAPLS